MNLAPAARPIVVTGTGTNIGKTFAACKLLDLLRLRGVRARGLKPVETGYRLETSDAAALASAAGHSIVSPLFTASDPVSPHRAARGRSPTLTSAEIAHWVETHRQGGPCLVETAGGLFSPLNQSETMLDIVRALESCFFLLVAPDRLGTLHDVKSTLLAAQTAHRIPDAILLNRIEPNDLDNATELAYLQIGVPTFSLDRSDDPIKLCDLMLR